MGFRLLLGTWVSLFAQMDASMDDYSCDATRETGFSNQRALHIPAKMWDSADTDDRTWATKLCCVYTRVERDESAFTQEGPSLIVFDGSVRRRYTTVTNLQVAAQNAYEEICAMP